MEAAVKQFFSTPTFAVVGASSDTSKYGHKVFTWYLAHSLPVTPINPRATEVNVPRYKKSFATLPSVSDLPSPEQTAVSIITPPAVTLKVLQEAKKCGIKAVWCQPGSFDDEGMKLIKEFVAGVAGEGGNGGEGWCVLADGDDGLRWADRSQESGKL